MAIPTGAWPRCPAHLRLRGQRAIVPKPPPRPTLGKCSRPRARCSSTEDPAATAIFNRKSPNTLLFFFFLRDFLRSGFFLSHKAPTGVGSWGWAEPAGLLQNPSETHPWVPG